MKVIVVTNNRLVYDKYKNLVKIKFLEKHTYLDVLKFVRDKVHIGYKLYTHPLSGSIKPNETPYKSVIISEEKNQLTLKAFLL